MMRRSALAIMFAVLVMPGGDPALAGRFPVLAREGGNGGPYVNLIVREIRAVPVRAHVGDAVRVDLVIENRGEGYGTVPIRVYANGREVAGRLYTYGLGEADRVFRESFVWDTKNAAPGEYRLRGEIYVSYDSSEFDNYLDLADRIILVPAGEPLPPMPAGGPASVTRDPRWKPSPGGEGAPGERAGGGY